MFRVTSKTFEVIYSPVVFSSMNTHRQRANLNFSASLFFFFFPPQEDQRTPYPPFETHNCQELKLCKSVGDWQCKDKHLDSPSSSPPWRSSLCSMWRQPTLFSTSWSLSAWSSERVRAVTRHTYRVSRVIAVCEHACCCRRRCCRRCCQVWCCHIRQTPWPVTSPCCCSWLLWMLCTSSAVRATHAHVITFARGYYIVNSLWANIYLHVVHNCSQTYYF